MTERARPRILVVEDDPDELELFGGVLERHGFATTLASTAEEGLAALRGEPFCMVVVDYNLPDGTGTAMLRAAGEDGLLAETKLVLATAYPFPDRDADVQLLKKPVDVPLLLQIAHEAARARL